MKFYSILSLLAASSTVFAAAAEPDHAKRQVQTLFATLVKIQNSAAAYTNSIKSYNCDASALFNGHRDFINVLQTGLESIRPVQPSTLTEMVSVQGYVQNVQSEAESLVSAFEGKMSILENTGFTPFVLSSLESARWLLLEINITIKSKAPAEVRTLVETLTQGVTLALDKGITQWKAIKDKGPERKNPLCSA